MTLFPEKGKHGSIEAFINIVDEVDRWRSGDDVHSRHYVTLNDAINGCKVSIPTVYGDKEIELKPRKEIGSQRLQGQGIGKFVAEDVQSNRGDHICSVITQIPRDVDDNMRGLAT